MNVRRWTTLVSATALAATALVTGTATAASAAPTDCSHQVSGLQASSYCATGTGEHRIRVLQRHFLPEVGLIPIIGPWQPAGTASVTGITPHQIVSIWVETR
ncbi:hypothetical protein GCM10010156_23990 [Planobispora rosea]|uniref:Secreted protein n=1 Tax=Planobispora rosea TaxID=35762 RepID=A0A8J3S062_PLARO|nr:hypothetical protein [Planobispora rosea]GGS64124.1 hypothetical protein GCM10010156_23990 [Planobispora rosea]GIH84563.1 hypothetical protein Pro02_29710 [Planobispora rosea]